MATTNLYKGKANHNDICQSHGVIVIVRYVAETKASHEELVDDDGREVAMTNEATRQRGQAP